MQGGRPGLNAGGPDPRADRTIIVESITADKEAIYLPDRVSGTSSVDPKSPKPVVVGRIESRNKG
jgi:hypothetical protein